MNRRLTFTTFIFTKLKAIWSWRYTKPVSVGVVLASITLLVWLTTVALSNKQSPVVDPGIRILVVPHDDLLSKEFTSFYSHFSPLQKKQVTTIVLLSLNQDTSASQKVITSERPFNTADDDTGDTSTLLSEQLRDIGVVFDTEAVTNNSSIQMQLPYIFEQFPDAEVVPIVLTRNVSQKKLEELSLLFGEYFNQPATIMIASVDFSHNLSPAEAARNDHKTMRYVQSENINRVASLKDEYLDCPSCMSIVLRLVRQLRLDGPEQHFHSDSVSYLKQDDQSPTTSYFVWSWHESVD